MGINADIKTVLITGASRGIGKAIALAFAEAGYKVIATDIEREINVLASLKNEIEHIGKSCLTYSLDVTSKTELDQLVANLRRDRQAVDVLVNNAGILQISTLQDLQESQWNAHFDVNAKGVWLTTQAFAPYMKEQGDKRIINTASLAGRCGVPGQGHYAATKAAVISLTRVAAQELGPDGFTVNAICPGIILTEMGRNNLGSEEMITYWEGRTALRRLGQPEDVAGAVLFFASPMADFITGQSINIDGGIYFH
ncbi:SDR family NAD(P)-dependent oxidoreductase [Serratia rhizosphaerae]|uniref:SDR family oxidoreductase n=1 Tax=Serratia rhizosphaerae TaxID=2597702 RepID=A0ABX6GP55_9GAMM|nr:SDR family NAD(P)-dependent oxidoreductase [Serratia rhizosphaerae]QHA88052.1 SDR family oxidoreductase [Serratia rhizosphaerae]